MRAVEGEANTFSVTSPSWTISGSSGGIAQEA
jgi:hypothetical protein